LLEVQVVSLFRFIIRSACKCQYGLLPPYLSMSLVYSGHFDFRRDCSLILTLTKDEIRSPRRPAIFRSTSVLLTLVSLRT